MPKMWHDMEKGLKKKGYSENSSYAIATAAYEKKTGKTPQGKSVKTLRKQQAKKK